MKKALLVCVVVLCAAASVFAGDFKFLFKDLDQHVELLKGFLPTLVQAGVSYEGFNFVDGNLTQLQVSAGGGYVQRLIYQDPADGTPLTENIQIYDVVQVRWDAALLQGFGTSTVQGKDLVTAYIGYQGRWETPLDSLLVKGGGLPKPKSIARWRGGSVKTDVESFESWFGHFSGITAENTPVYREFNGGGSSVFNVLYAGARLNLMEDRMVANNGMLAELRFQYAPSFMNKYADFYSIMLNAVYGTTLYELSAKNGKNLFSITLLDRVNVSWADGNYIPVYAQSPFSLGRKVRGYGSNSYNTNFAAVNNFEVRFAGPEPFIKGIFPRLNVFCDVGYGFGKYFNTGHNGVEAVKGNNFLASVGAQLEVCFFDMFDLGFQVSYLLSDARNLRNPGSRIQTAATFFLDF